MMRILGLAGGAIFGICVLAQAEAPVPGYIMQKLESGRIVTTENASISIYGVRLVDENEDAAIYRKAREFILDSLQGQPFHLETNEFGKTGSLQNRYGDLQGRIMTADGQWLQEILIAEGYGWWSAPPNFPPVFRQRLVMAEKQAAEQRLGLWQEFSVIDANRPPERYWNGQFIIAKGLVRDVYRSSNATYLNFGEDWQNDFTAAIPSSSRKKFERGDWKLADLKSKSVTVRGFVRFYNGPYLELEFPEQLEIEEIVGEG
ncbi:MAG: thermonuclease family protein [Sneathiella sp.]